MPRDDRAYLEDAIAACREIQRYTNGLDLDSYLESDGMLLAAVERQFEIVGEALNNASQRDASLIGAVPEVPQIVAFRNLLSHEYFKAGHKDIWDIIQHDLPELLEKLISFREGEDNDMA